MATTVAPTDLTAPGTLAPPPAVAPPARRERLLALDVFRGATIAAMLLVNDPGSWGAIYPPLEHAAWNGWTPTDLIFPFFLFIVGITTHLSLESRRARGVDDSELVKQIVRRGAVIFLLGFLMSLFPFYQWGTVDGIANPSFWQRIVDRWEHVRILGVLQRIGIVYIAAALLTLRTTLKQQVIIIAVILYGYWFAMTLIPVPGRGGGIGALLLDDRSATLAAYLDRAILGMNHIWIGGVTFDPEGLLSTIPAIATSILGVIAGRWIASPRPILERLVGLFAAGAIAMVIGLMWGWVFPINKSLWTSSYVIFTAGMACVTIAACIWVIDVLRITWWTKPFVVFGVNPILAYVGSGVMARLIYTLWKVRYNGTVVPVQGAIYQSVFASWLEPRNASLAFALAYVLFWYVIVLALYRRKIFLKV